MKPSPHLIAIDFETGGLSPHRNPILAIGAVSSGGSEFERYILPWPEHLSIDPIAAKKNGYTPERWKAHGAVSLTRAFDDWNQWLDDVTKKEGRAHFVAHNAGFDRGFYEKMYSLIDAKVPVFPENLRRFFQELKHDHRWRCSHAAMLALMDAGIIEAESSSLDSLCTAAGVTRQFSVWDGVEYHGALADARAALAGWQWMQSRLQRMRRIEEQHDFEIGRMKAQNDFISITETEPKKERGAAI